MNASPLPRLDAPPSVRRARPRGYFGRNHETLGIDIRALTQSLRAPATVLGPAQYDRLLQIEPATWYPIEDLLRLLDILDAEMGDYGLMGMGRKVFESSHAERFKGSNPCGRSVVYGIDQMYRAVNRGISIGGWTVAEFAPGHAVLEKNTPHHCVMEQGILKAAFSAAGCPSIVTQSTCFRRGDDICTYLISSSITDQRWTGLQPGPSGIGSTSF